MWFDSNPKFRLSVRWESLETRQRPRGGTVDWDIVVPDTVPYPVLQVAHSIQRNSQDFSVFPGS